ncbi:Afg1 protein [Maudiozyma humilis]|uniref:Afg1 protein n=1 Tax=Maudiozyma humilis TaxID=51915 RepID=A0AAV5RRZ5_MAUHU|nr:Afg1 protein [Kazachstania humilis]
MYIATLRTVASPQWSRLGAAALASRCLSSTTAPGQQQPQTAGRTPVQEYDRQVKLGKLRDDPFQRNILKSMNDLYAELVAYQPPDTAAIRLPLPNENLTWRAKLRAAFSRSRGRDIADIDIAAIGAGLPKGIYLYGDVGCGKTMLMDLFYTTVPPHLSKRRIHFHQFMQYVHKRNHDILNEQRELRDDPDEEIDTIPFLAKEIAMKYRVLCFDEFQVTDVADAMILRRLITTILSDDYGVILFATSNRKPDDLYINGIQRESFVPCIQLIKNRTHVIYLNSETDYRKIPRPVSPVYYYPKGGLKYSSHECAVFRQSHVKEWFDYFAQAKHDDDSPVPGETVHKEFTNFPLSIWGREFMVPRCIPPRVAQFTFKELCGEPLAAGDYLTLAKNFDAFVVTDIPYLTVYVRDEVRRFITFLDAVYDNGGKLATTGAADFTDLFVEPEDILNDYELKPRDAAEEKAVEDAVDAEEKNDALVTKHGFSKEIAKKSHMFALDEERFAFARALSRLTQMSNTDWVTK